MTKKNKDTVEILEETVKQLKKVIRDRDKTIKQLKSEVKTVQGAWKTTEIFLKEVTDGKPLSEIIKTVATGKPLSKSNGSCPKCGSKAMKKIIFIGFHIISCDCGYRTKIDEEQEINKNTET